MSLSSKIYPVPQPERVIRRLELTNSSVMPGIGDSRIYFVYVLESERDGKRYIGFTNDVHRRLTEHNLGRSFATSFRLPMKLIYLEGCTNEEDARRREGYLKTTRGRRFLAKRLQAYYRAREKHRYG